MEYENDQTALNHKYDCLLFDLDDTLYPMSSGVASQCRKNIQGANFLCKVVNVYVYYVQMSKMTTKRGFFSIPDMCYVLYKNYGTTMADLRAIGYNFDYDHYHSLFHGRLPYDLLKPDLVLRKLLLSLPIRRVILTNADKRLAAQALKRLGLEDCFEQIICFETLNPTIGNKEENSSEVSEIFNIMEYQPSSNQPLPPTPVVCKPFESGFERAFEIAEINPKRTFFFDDSIRNLITGNNLGLHTVLVGKAEKSEGADYALESIHNIREAFPELFGDEEERLENVCFSPKIAVQA